MSTSDPYRPPTDVTTNCQRASDFDLHPDDWVHDLFERHGPAYKSPPHAMATARAMRACGSCPVFGECRAHARRMIADGGSAVTPVVLGGLYVVPGPRQREPRFLALALRQLALDEQQRRSDDDALAS